MMGRLQNSVKNAKVSITFTVITLVLTFFSRKIFIDSLGVNLVGLTATLQNILGFLNLAELGIVSAIASTLYKPLYLEDKNCINDIISIYGYLYRKIGISILCIGGLVSLFLPLFFRNSGVDIVDVYLGYWTYLGISMIGYFISYRQTLLDADQKQYIVVAVTNIANISKIILQIVCLKYLGCGYVVWLIIEFVFGTIYGFWINSKVSQSYPWLTTSYKRGRLMRKEYVGLFDTIKKVIPHKLGSFVLNQTSNVLIYAFSSLSMVTFYNNYLLILSKAVFVITTGFSGIGGSIGNLIAEGNREVIKRVFWELHFWFFLLGSILVITSYYLIEPFINLWLGDGFILDRLILIIMLFNIFVSIIRNPIGYYLNAYILFKDIWAPIAEATINLLCAIVLGYFYGISGVLLGSSISLLIIILIWKPYFLYKEAFHESVLEYWIEFIKFILALFFTWFVISSCIHYVIGDSIDSFLSWIKAALILVSMALILYVFFAVLLCKGGKAAMKRMQSYFS